MHQIIQTMVHQVLISLMYSNLVASDFLAYDDNLTIHFTIQRSRSYLYKVILRYDEGFDTYSIRFMKMYIGADLDRSDWYVALVTDWLDDIYFDMLKDVIESLYRDRYEHRYHNIADEV